jgi:hypothetical protein
VRHRLLIGCSVLSLSACAAALFAWVATTWWSFRPLAWNPPPGRVLVSVGAAGVTFRKTERERAVALQMPPGSSTQIRTSSLSVSSARRTSWGVTYANGSNSAGPVDWPGKPVLMIPWRSVTIPFPHLAAAAGLLPAVAAPGLARRLRTRRRAAAGLCLPCGYDMRATPGRCPECGAEPAAR